VPELDMTRAMPRLTAALTILVFLHPIMAARAQEASAGTPAEISHLLNHIRKSDCMFVRNGVGYDGRIAAAFVQRKYESLQDKVRNAEDFILLVATKSEESGKPYQVRCPGRQAIDASRWLRIELQSYLARANLE
jgi:hypothetical protein